MARGSSLVDYAYRDAGRVQTSMLTMPAAIAAEFPFDETLRVNQDTDLAMRLDRAGIGFEISDVPGIAKEETPADHRLTSGAETADLSHQWYLRESHDWSRAAKSGYHLQDRVWRLQDSGRIGAASLALLRTLFPPVSPKETARRAVSMALGPRGYAALQRRMRKRRACDETPAGPVLSRWQDLTREAKRICAGLATGSGARRETRPDGGSS